MADAIRYETCPQHPFVLLPIALRTGERHFCYACGQAQRRETYARQRDEQYPKFLTCTAP